MRATATAQIAQALQNIVTLVQPQPQAPQIQVPDELEGQVQTSEYHSQDSLILTCGARTTPPPASTPSSSGATRGTNNSADSLASHDPHDPFMSENSSGSGQQHRQQQQHRPPRPPDDQHQHQQRDPAAGQQHGANLQVVPPRRPYVRQSSFPSPLSPFAQQPQSPQHAFLPPPYVAYGQGGYQAQYTMAPQPPSQVVQSPPHFAYTHAYAHPPIMAHDPSPLSALGYRTTPTSQQPSPGIFPFLHPHPPSESPAGPSSAPYTVGAAPPSEQQQQQQQHPPPSPHTPLTTQAAFGQFPMHYSASPQSFYPPHTYSPTAPAIYASQYQAAAAPYSQSYLSPTTGDESKGTWWFFPTQPVARPSTGFEQHNFSTAYQQQPSVSYSSAAQPRRETDTYSSPVPAPLPPLSPFPSSPAVPNSAGFPRSGPPSSEYPHSPMRSPASSRLGNRGGNRSPVTRMAYHPTVPASRSEWVMWVGNVPSDATEDELRAFFNAGPAGMPGQGPPSEGGVTSVFLIARSNCAFVNFRSQAHLERAVHFFNGQPLRPADARCPRLVCRVRKKDDDLKAGVGGQRGMGMHTRWVRDQDKEKAEREAALAADPRAGADERPGPVTHPRESTSTSMASNSSGSYASTNSSFLSKHFPKRYFIMKSLTEQQLLKSVECGLWSTQKHNEGILDQAYRTSRDVYLIFSANKSGEFFGYARMAGRVVSSEPGATVTSVGWHSRAESLGKGLPNLKEEDEAEQNTSSGNLALPNPDDKLQRKSDATDTTLVEQSAVPARMFPEARFAEASPSPLTPGDALDYTSARIAKEKSPAQQASAPPELGQAHQPISYEDLRRGADTWDSKPLRAREPNTVEPVQHADSVGSANVMSTRKFSSSPPRFSLDPEAAVKAVREGGSAGRSEPALALGEDKDKDAGEDKEAADWGTPFPIEWLCTTRLPFQRTRNLRNPWNHDREVKVSRDGTELEPTAGARLLEEWARPDGDAVPPPSTSTRRGRGARGGGGGQHRSQAGGGDAS